MFSLGWTENLAVDMLPLAQPEPSGFNVTTTGFLIFVPGNAADEINTMTMTETSCLACILSAPN